MPQNRSWTAVLLVIVLLGVGCATANRESSADEAPVEMIPTEAELTEQLTGGQPSEAQLRAFEVRARQKLRDFADYLTIVADPTLDRAFRQEAQRQATDLFVSDQVQINLSPNSSKNEAAAPQNLSDLMQANTEIVSITEEPTMSQPLAQRTGGQYTGELVFDWLPSGQTSRTEGHAQVVLKKVTKRFGEEEEQVWEVFLGDIW